MASLWMGDLEPYMTEGFITEAFASQGENILGVKIIRHRVTGGLTGYCFVDFPDKESAEKCLLKLGGRHIPGTSFTKRFRLKHALCTKQPETGVLKSNIPNLMPNNSNDVNQQQVHEYIQAFNYYTQQFQQLMSNWKYDPKSGSYSYQQYGYTPSSWQTPEDMGDDALEDPLSALDVNEANQQFMEQSEEFYEALMDCHWQPLDTVTSKIPTE
ncbi:tRNA selenocysteine 1-associated protein 1 [Spea bombifrons]|uniref:tRNA selenocysteine 1-associated protein 1 n=1 Tax=Spea bombifrons TaxID=233779 RepID=UPI00234A21A0|nr:tRNA selenocysteine 1-associated protein 1 [Spea bombifrons]